MFFFSKGKIPRLINRLGYNPKDHKVEKEVPLKRKRSENKGNTRDVDESFISEASTTETKPIPNGPNARHKLRRTKKHENLREEWKKYHNNFIPVIPKDSANFVTTSSLKPVTTLEEAKIQFNSSNYNDFKFSLRDSYNSSNNIKMEEKTKPNIPERHVSKKRRLFSFIPL